MEQTLQYKEVNGLFKNKGDFVEWLKFKDNISLNLSHREFGDYQTPSGLVKRVYDVLEYKKISYSEIIEPTCGEGNFIKEALSRNNRDELNIKKIIGIEKQHGYVDELRNYIISKKLYEEVDIELYEENFFEFDFSKTTFNNLLVIGNPPWITNSELTSLKSDNLPEKSNFKKSKGMDALTGKSNFDIAEFILISLIDNVNANGKGTIAFLVKNIVIRNILKYSKDIDWNITTFEVYNFDAKKEFGVSTDASLVLIRIGEEKKKVEQAVVYSIYDYTKPISKFGWVGTEFVSNVDKYLLGKLVEKGQAKEEHFIWRSGIKHDASKVMELSNCQEGIIAKDGTVFNADQSCIYPLYKSSDISKIEKDSIPRKFVIVTQRKIGESTDEIERQDKKTWKYLLRNKNVLDNRKSSIYKGKPQFSIFGVGEYSFSKYKIAISGMYKIAKFSLIEPYKGKTVMVDDTVYFLSTDNKFDALIIFGLLNNQIVKAFLESIVFTDSKRPYTKEILMRISIPKITKYVSLEEINQVLEMHHYDFITQKEYNRFISNLNS